MLTAETGESRWLVLITSGSAVLVAFFGMLVMIAPHAGKAGVAIVNAAYPVVQLIWKQRDELLGQTKKLRQDLAENTRITAEAQEAARKLGEEAKEAAQRNTETIETLLEQNKKLAEQNEKLQTTIEEDRESTNKARETLHAMRKEFNIATLQHREQREALIAELGAVTSSLTAARLEIADLKEHDSRRIKEVAARQDIKIEQNKAAVAETKAAVAELRDAAEQSGAIPIVEVPKDSAPPTAEKPS